MQPNVTIQNLNSLTLNIHTYQSVPELADLGLAFAVGSAPVQEAPQAIEIPAIGQIWPGQGGINGGLVPPRGDVPEHYLIIATEDAGSHQWGGRGVESVATSKTDGLENTQALVGSDTHYPAAKAASNYVAEGHGDFYLPSAAELYQAWVNCPESFAKEWYWSSTQRSADLAFFQGFVDGGQGNLVKGVEFRVRPVRRLFI